MTHLLTAALVLLTSSYAVMLYPARLAQLPPRVGPAIAAAGSWGYQLQNVRARSVPDAIDLLVVDYARDGIVSRSQADVRALATRADGSRRTVLAYLSIGEAESYRWYWQPTWRYWGPAWLGPENKDWRGNYQVRYWDRDWQRLIVDPLPDAAGFI
ncbi:MAG: endo alpha-1,4 polygalactosaminidase, partial [Hyphomicrobiaceae bacterium]|nr:endo alpha-1,4 polygalactosaminidase [Hyphomicrobiaceae bacterium]